MIAQLAGSHGSTLSSICLRGIDEGVTHKWRTPLYGYDYIISTEKELVVNQPGRMLIKKLDAGTARAGELTSIKVNGRDLKEGMYLARLVSDSGSHTFKLVLKR